MKAIFRNAANLVAAFFSLMSGAFWWSIAIAQAAITELETQVASVAVAKYVALSLEQNYLAACFAAVAGVAAGIASLLDA